MIRPTIIEDVPALVALTEATGFFRPVELKALGEVFDDYFRKEHAAGHECVTYVEDDRLLGFAYFAPAAVAERAWQLWWIVVSPEMHGRGVGSQLLRYVEEGVRRREGRVLFIDTSSTPRYDATRRFYLKHGYEQHAVLREFYNTGDDMVVFRKSFVE